MDPHYIPLLLIAIATVAFVIWGIVYTWMTGKPFIVFNPGVPNGIVENASSVATALERREEMIRFIETPSQENYLSLHNIIATSDAYAPYSDEFDTAIAFCEHDRLVEARNTLQKGMGNLMLSPRAHQLLGFLHHKLGDEKAAQMEGMIGRACIEGLLATGDGTEQRPYIVLRTSDEHDVIEHFERELKQQSLTNSDDKHIDLVECTDGSKYWFDITLAYRSLARTLG